MMDSLTTLTLSTINSGAAEELFQQALKVVYDNINDPNYPDDKGRAIALVLDFKAKNSGHIEVSITCDTKLPKRLGHSQEAFVILDDKTGKGHLMQGKDPRALQIEMNAGVKNIKEAQNG